MTIKEPRIEALSSPIKPFRKVHDKNFAVVHNLADVKGTFWLTNNITNDRVGGKGTNLI